MPRDKEKTKAPRAPKPTVEDDTNNTLNEPDPETRAIGFILPEARDHPDLYKRVINLLQASNIKRSKMLYGCTLVTAFHGWLMAVGENDRPRLDFFLAIYAASLALPTANNRMTIFSQAVADRDLLTWAREQLRQGSSSPSQRVASSNVLAKKENGDRHKVHEIRPAPNSDLVVPSIEQPHEMAQPPSATRPPPVPYSPLRSLSPFRPCQTLKRKSSEIAEAQDSGVWPKMAKSSDTHGPQTIVLREASTQTDDNIANQWVMDLANKLVQPGKRAFDDAITQQTKTLMDYLPGAMKKVFQQAIATEMAHQQPTSNLHAQLVRPVGTEMSLARPNHQNHGEPTYSRARVFEAVDDRREGLRTGMASDFDLLNGLGGYRLTRLNQRRFYE
ncbi:hypothetical protein B0T10DRAFT_590117 [Thelonectria olida]|uniref:Uncharacterized protein n=1 Tax=Thelonectria olida TaxID=1576542 RepID=A0A9P8W959_9HYPO|nr:hypothetical protein B0T10DRAFT_590117 [Thelonectria olida]